MKRTLWACGICLIILTLSSGCSTGLFYLPDEPFCELKKEDACKERYKEKLRWAKELREAYSVRAKFNRLSNYIAGGVAATGGAAVVGLAAFDKSDSDAAKVVPIASSLIAGIFVLMDNDGLARAYLDARDDIRDAISNNRPKNEDKKDEGKAYDDAANGLVNAVNDVIAELDKKRVELSNPPDATKAKAIEYVNKLIDKVYKDMNKK